MILLNAKQFNALKKKAQKYRDAQLELATYYYAIKNTSQATIEFEKLLDKNDEIASQAKLQLADYRVNNNEPQRAIELLNSIPKAHCQYAHAQLKLAIIYTSVVVVENHIKALIAYTLALKANEDIQGTENTQFSQIEITVKDKLQHHFKNINHDEVHQENINRAFAMLLYGIGFDNLIVEQNKNKLFLSEVYQLTRLAYDKELITKSVYYDILSELKKVKNCNDKYKLSIDYRILRLSLDCLTSENKVTSLQFNLNETLNIAEQLDKNYTGRVTSNHIKLQKIHLIIEALKKITSEQISLSNELNDKNITELKQHKKIYPFDTIWNHTSPFGTSVTLVLHILWGYWIYHYTHDTVIRAINYTLNISSLLVTIPIVITILAAIIYHCDIAITARKIKAGINNRCHQKENDIVAKGLRTLEEDLNKIGNKKTCHYGKINTLFYHPANTTAPNDDKKLLKHTEVKPKKEIEIAPSMGCVIK